MSTEEKTIQKTDHKNYNPAWNLEKNSLEYIKNKIQTENLKNILEVGTYNALTAIAISQINQEIKVTTIEVDKEFLNLAKQNISESKQKNINLIKGDAKEVLKDLSDKDEKFDLIFIDAKKSEYKEYLIISLKLIKKGFILIDNTISHKYKLTDFLEYLKDSKLKWRELGIGKGMIEIKI